MSHVQQNARSSTKKSNYKFGGLQMLRGKDFVLSPEKLEREYMLVEVSEWKNFDTKEKMGTSYTVLFPKLQYEKIRVNVPDIRPIATKEDLERQGKIPIAFEGLVTHASVFNGKLSVKAEAKGVNLVTKPQNPTHKPAEVK